MLLSFKRFIAAVLKNPRRVLPAMTEHIPYVLGIVAWKAKRFFLGQAREVSPDTPFCSKPFEWLEAKNDGNAYLCCSAWLPVSVGNLHREDPQTVWTSKLARQIRESVLDGSYAFCSAKRCPELIGKALPAAKTISDPRLQEILRTRDTVVAEGAKTINASYDRTCNLACPSCRTEVLSANEPERVRAEALQNRLLRWNPEGLHTLYLTGSGDPFASPLFRKLLLSLDPSAYPNLRLRLHTNGLLFTPELWKGMERIHSIIDTIEVSIDAATDPTYRKLRRGGEMALLRQRLEFLKGVRGEGHVRTLLFSFVVQADNYAEMPEFVALGDRYGATHIYFSGLLNWGTFTAKEYSARAVHRPRHPRHDEFLHVLKHPSLARPHVTLGIPTPH